MSYRLEGKRQNAGGGGAQYARILDPVFAKSSPKRLFSVTVNERFGLAFAKTGSINLVCSCAHRAQLNFDDLTPYILRQKQITSINLPGSRQ
jgi:hypothetical protein